jgi:hypothetical protein
MLLRQYYIACAYCDQNTLLESPRPFFGMLSHLYLCIIPFSFFPDGNSPAPRLQADVLQNVQPSAPLQKTGIWMNIVLSLFLSALLPPT